MKELKGNSAIVLTILFLAVLESALFPVIWIFVKYLNQSFCNNAILDNVSSPRYVEGCSNINGILLTIPFLMIVVFILTFIGGVGIIMYFSVKKN